MSVSLNVITPQGLEPLQFPTKFRSPSGSVVSEHRSLNQSENSTYRPFTVSARMGDMQDRQTMIEAWTELGDKPNILGAEIKALGLV